MIKIAICDDEEVFARHLRQIVSAYLDEQSAFYEIHFYSSGEEFVRLNMDMLSYQIVFLDINMKDLDGIVTAKKLRELSGDTYIVFVTAFINYALVGYEVNAIRYILKNVANFEKSINECLNAILKKMNYKVMVHTFPFKEGVKEINEDQIIYIESNLHELRFHITNQKLVEKHLEDTLNHIEVLLDEKKFVRIHQSFLVNMKYVKSMKAQKVFLYDGSELPIARPRYKKVREIYADYKGDI